ncbi:Hypothetical protein CINCED_3A005322, partial [Cinara cedri]
EWKNSAQFHGVLATNIIYQSTQHHEQFKLTLRRSVTSERIDLLKLWRLRRKIPHNPSRQPKPTHSGDQ